MTADALASMTTEERLALWRKDIENNHSAQLTVYVHGLAAGEAGVDEEEAMPSGMSDDLKAAWKRCYWRGAQTRNPATAQTSANPNREADMGTALRDWEVDQDLIG